MSPEKLVRLPDLMARTAGHPDVIIGLIDGPVDTGHIDLKGARVRQVGSQHGCSRADSVACSHGTFVAGILCASRTSSAPAICPNCTLVARSIFAEDLSNEMPNAEPDEVASAIIECIDLGARVINLSVALANPSGRSQPALEAAISLAARKGVIIVAAAGNQGTLGSTAITGHPWTIPVAACDALGRPSSGTNLGHSIGRRGLLAPGGHVTSLGPNGDGLTLGGTSAAAPFVTGTVGLLLSLFPSAAAVELKQALVPRVSNRFASVVPPLLDASVAYARLAHLHS
jgi:subtilisin family serine protease